LRDYIERHHGVVYVSKQSYYDLLKEGGLSWHQTQAVNPKGDPAQVELRREEIKKKLDGLESKEPRRLRRGFLKRQKTDLG